MGLFDKLKNTAASAVGGAVNNAAMSIGNKSETSRRLHLLYAHCVPMRQTKISVRKCSTG